MKPGLLAVVWLCAASSSAFAEPDAEHGRIAADRAAANATFEAQQRECAKRFVVAACVDDARTAHRETLSRLRRQELQLDEARRHAAAEGRRKAIAEKAQQPQARASDAPPDPPRVRMRRAAPAGSEPASRIDEDNAAREPEPGAARVNRNVNEQREQQRFEVRRREAQAHREAVADRNALRAARGKVAAPLPSPSAPR